MRLRHLAVEQWFKGKMFTSVIHTEQREYEHTASYQQLTRHPKTIIDDNLSHICAHKLMIIHLVTKHIKLIGFLETQINAVK